MKKMLVIQIVSQSHYGLRGINPHHPTPQKHKCIQAHRKYISNCNGTMPST